MQTPETPVSPTRKFSFRDVPLLMVVIGVGALLLYVFAGSGREKRYASTCQSNLKRLGLSFFQYTRDYDETFPLATSGINARLLPTKFSSDIGWADAMQPYLKSLPDLQCPSEPTKADTDPSSKGYSDYFYNCALSWNGKTDPKKVRWDRGVKMDSLITPTLTIMLGDCDMTGATGTARTRSNGYDSSGERDIRKPDVAAPRNGHFSPQGPLGNRHRKGLNFCFADGHVKWLAINSDHPTPPIYNFNTSMAVSGTNFTFNVAQP